MNASPLADVAGSLLIETGVTPRTLQFMSTSFPTTALDPTGRVVSILVTPEGRLVTDLTPLPTETVPIQTTSLAIDDAGRVLIA